MTHLAAIPLWAAILIAALLVLGSSLTLLGTIGLIRLRSFYDRLHAPTLGTSWGTAGIVLASILLFSLGHGRLALHELLIGVFVMVTTPVTMMLLGRVALHRDRKEGSPELDDVSQPERDSGNHPPRLPRTTNVGVSNM